MKYKDGDIVGPYGAVLIKRTKKMSCGAWRGLFLCPFHSIDDPHYFDSDIHSVSAGIKYHCGCQGQKPREIEDLTGQTFGRLTVLKLSCRISSKDQIDKKHPRMGVYWLCQCSCPEHNLIEVSTSNLKSGGVSSCGCLRRETSQHQAVIMGIQNRVDLTGQKIGTWTALKRTNEKDGTSFLWDCVCENGHHSLISTSNWGKILFCKQCKNPHYSKGEYIIQTFLESKQIIFYKEYTFEDCKDKRPLRFDFYLPDYNCCIEYDGEQHFKDTGYGRDTLTTRQMHDKIKNKYCQDNHIKLVRFNYLEIGSMTDDYIEKKIF